MCVCDGDVFCWVSASLTVSIFCCPLLALYLWVQLFPTVGWTLTYCLIGCVCFLLPSKLLRARPTETPGMSVQTGLSSTFLSNSSEVESQKKHIYVWEQEGVSDSWTFSSLKGLVKCCLVMIPGLWLVTYMHANNFFTTGFNKFCSSSVVQQLGSCWLFVFKLLGKNLTTKALHMFVIATNLSLHSIFKHA